MNNANIFVNISMLIILIIFFRKLIGNFMEAHVTNQPLVFGSRYLRETKENLDIKASILENPSKSMKYTYNLWLFFENISSENIDSDNSDKEIFIHKSQSGTSGANPFELFYNHKSSTIYAKINNTKYSIVVPQQKWINISINIDTTIVDFYLDSELVKSEKLVNITNIPGGNIELITSCCAEESKKSGIYGYIDIFRYFNEYLKPDRVKEIYLAGVPGKNDNPSDNTFWWY